MGFLQFGCIWNSERLRYNAQPQVKTGADVLPLHRQKRALMQPVWMDTSPTGGSSFSVQGDGSGPAVEVNRSIRL